MADEKYLMGLMDWMSATIVIGSPEIKEMGPLERQSLVRRAMDEITRSVRGNRNQKIEASDLRALYEATLIWCLRKSGRPEIAPAEATI